MIKYLFKYQRGSGFLRATEIVRDMRSELTKQMLTEGSEHLEKSLVKSEVMTQLTDRLYEAFDVGDY